MPCRGLKYLDLHKLTPRDFVSFFFMGPTRSSSSSHNRKIKGTQRNDGVPSTSVPGVQKIKSALRQTRRLLAKVHTNALAITALN